MVVEAVVTQIRIFLIVMIHATWKLRIGDINFLDEPPCQTNLYTGDFTSGSFLSMHNRCSDNNGAGYGIDELIINSALQLHQLL